MGIKFYVPSGLRDLLSVPSGAMENASKDFCVRSLRQNYSGDYKILTEGQGQRDDVYLMNVQSASDADMYTWWITSLNQKEVLFLLISFDSTSRLLEASAARRCVPPKQVPLPGEFSQLAHKQREKIWLPLLLEQGMQTRERAHCARSVFPFGDKGFIQALKPWPDSLNESSMLQTTLRTWMQWVWTHLSCNTDFW